MISLPRRQLSFKISNIDPEQNINNWNDGINYAYMLTTKSG